MIGQRMLAASLLVLAIATHHALAANFVFGPNTKVVADVWDAENQLILQPSGRLIVTGGDNIYEIVRSGSTYTKIPLMSGPGYYLGLSQVNNTLYALQSVPGCSTNESATTNFLLSAPIVDGKQLVFSKIYAIQSFTLPNGMAFYDNKFYIADTAYTGSGKIATLALSPSDPNVITAQVTFLTTAQAEAPNGVKIFNNTLYYSSLGTVKSVLLTQVGRCVVDARTQASPKK
ncbi:hypothetical protein, variant [Capsaspora owczarzaki ATCC 30864]|uniref:Uncharacterized protein n=1 Tax=Capsaspora owczarzaki (strain ATCC 30864) TaxID=595528 RepID=A0A0D2WMM5_CAPO3|nr:hypothetical protein, variant [Capsaspora owczarzaki ATCC 30864]